MRLAYRVQTTVKMEMLGLQKGKVARFDPVKEEILL